MAAPAFAAEGTRVDNGPDGRAWTISNGLVERRVRFTDALGLHTDAFRRVPSGTDFLKGDKDRPEAEFGFLVLFRNGDAGATASVRWPAPAAGSFTLRPVEGGGATAALSEGVALALPPAGRVAILEVRRTV